ncbi:DUF885 domain-containing protein [Aliikangiella coralliicola]|uniref:DUF885 domain-containing protein n=1 Tax=Aliikangiella coralliicola TaxID=2592383 RepID=UPI001AEF7937|nr:DUF885 domain-containing protein [Aliikangiella coralliicola]
MKKIFLITCLLLAACGDDKSTQNNDSKQQVGKQTSEKTVSQPDQNEAFDDFKKKFLEEFWSLNPSYGVYVGYYKHDDKLVVPDKKSVAKEVAFTRKVLQQLKGFDIDKLSAANATDWSLIKNQIESAQWYREVFKSSHWNPSNYNVAGVFGVILNTEYKPLEERLRAISTRLDQVSAYYQAAIDNITVPTIEHTELAIQQNTGALSIFEKSIPESVESSTLSKAEKDAFTPKLEKAVAAINGYINWLKAKKEKIADGGARDFRIGESLYEQKFKHDIVSDYSAKELYQKALTAKQNLHQEMIKITTQLWPKYFPDTQIPAEPLVAVKQLIDHLSVKHVKRSDFVNEVKRQMPIIEKFIIEKDLLDMDPSRPLVIRETPEYQRGIAGASVNAPGPYDATANTYYNVTPLDHYTEEQAESYLREYNHWILQILNIHEAMPGHYTQLLHANKSPSLIKSIFGNGAMIEGWAVYSERMMLEAGYANDEPEMWLMYSKWNLRVVMNTILDYSIQVLGMTREDGLNLLMNEAFQERTEAEGKWRRATLTQVQLTSYYNGYAEIYAFREEMKNKLGDKFDLKKFHNKFLSYGSAPVPVIRSLMLRELGL